MRDPNDFDDTENAVTDDLVPTSDPAEPDDEDGDDDDFGDEDEDED